MINFFDTRKTLVDVTANAHFVEIYSNGTLELHTYQKDACISFKKVVNFSDGDVANFFGGNIIDLFDTKILVVLAANTHCVEIYRKGTGLDLEIHTHQKHFPGMIVDEETGGLNDMYLYRKNKPP